MALYFIKDTTLIGIADAIREKTGTTDSISVTDMATKISEITGGGGSGPAITTILEEGEFNFTYNSSRGCFISVNEGLFTLEAGKEYVVLWEGGEWPCVAYEGDFLGSGQTAIHLGNKRFLEAYSQGNMIETYEPFIIYYTPSSGVNCFMTFDTESSHNIGIVQGITVTHTVTFMSEDGSTVLCEKQVTHGDACGDIVVMGRIDTPTKESTAQYEYTFDGWATTAGGDADSNALVNVTEDRTVYAAFEEKTRAYVIRFLDGETVLQTMVCEYGTTPSYTPEKDGYAFIGWEPTISTVTGDADYYAQWIEAPLATGVCGDGVNWSLSAAGVLNVTGSGTMYNLASADEQPWREYKDTISSVVIANTVTNIGSYSFHGCAVQTVTTHDNITMIGGCAFQNCSSLNSITWPKGLTELGVYAFANCTSINGFGFLFESTALKKIGAYCFSGCSQIFAVAFPATLVYIGAYAFQGCTTMYNASMKNQLGWYACSSPSSTTGTNISVTDGAQFATYLHTTYVHKYIIDLDEI